MRRKKPPTGSRWKSDGFPWENPLDIIVFPHRTVTLQFKPWSQVQININGQHIDPCAQFIQTAIPLIISSLLLLLLLPLISLFLSAFDLVGHVALLFTQVAAVFSIVWSPSLLLVVQRLLPNIPPFASKTPQLLQVNCCQHLLGNQTVFPFSFVRQEYSPIKRILKIVQICRCFMVSSNRVPPLVKLRGVAQYQIGKPHEL